MLGGEIGKKPPIWCFKYLAAINKLTDKKYYNAVVQAVEHRNEELFKEVCGEADIPEEFVEPMLQMALHVGPAARWFPT